MQKLISKYGVAAHLAILAVAPLFLFPFVESDVIATVLLALSGFGGLWILIEPSRRSGEMLHDARFRVAKEIICDPFFWFSIVLVAVAACRWWNDSVTMAYDAENGVWALTSPDSEFLPGCVKGSGYLPFAGMVAFTVILQGARHALGKSARISLIFTSSTLAGISAVLYAVYACQHDARIISLMHCPITEESYVGATYGFYFILSTVALVGLYERSWKRAIVLLPLSIGGSALGLFVFSTPMMIKIFTYGFIVALALSLVYAAVKLSGAAAPKCVVFTFISMVLPVLMIMLVVPSEIDASRIETFKTWNFDVEGRAEAKKVLSRIAIDTWREHPWLGTGSASFGYDIRFKADVDDWQVIDPLQKSALNGWWQILAENGIVGSVLTVVPFFFLLWTWVRRLIGAIVIALDRRHLGFFFSTHPACWTGIIVIVVGIICTFEDMTFVRYDAMLPMWTGFALAGSFFPLIKKNTVDSEEV